MNVHFGMEIYALSRVCFGQLLAALACVHMLCERSSRDVERVRGWSRP